MSGEGRPGGAHARTRGSTAHSAVCAGFAGDCRKSAPGYVPHGPLCEGQVEGGLILRGPRPTGPRRVQASGAPPRGGGDMISPSRWACSRPDLRDGNSRYALAEPTPPR